MNSSYWSGFQQGNDGYPIKAGDYYQIGGGQDESFKAIAIEFYGVKT